MSDSIQLIPFEYCQLSYGRLTGKPKVSKEKHNSGNGFRANISGVEENKSEEEAYEEAQELHVKIVDAVLWQSDDIIFKEFAMHHLMFLGGGSIRNSSFHSQIFFINQLEKILIFEIR